MLSQREMFDINEIDSIKASLLALNDWAGEEVIRFNPYKLAVGTDTADHSDRLI